MNQTAKPLVSVCCITFNHEKYIRYAVDGILIQKTNFPFEIIIHDDFSVDGTADIIEEYVNKHSSLIVPIYQTENQYSKGVKPWPNFVFPRARGKYIALCEGDDYWTDPLKLQKQVDFLEKHSEFIICTHNHSTLHEDTGEINTNGKFRENFSYDLSKYMNSQVTPTLTACFRNIFKDYKYLSKEKIFSDFFLFFELLKHGKGYYMAENMATYRVHNQGVCSGLSREQYILNHIYMFEHLYKYNPWLIQLKSHIARYYMSHFNHMLRAEYKKTPSWSDLKRYLSYEYRFWEKLYAISIRIPYYLAVYWLPNIMGFRRI